MKDPIVIVGGGVMGLCTAHHLLGRGLEVVILEREDEIGAGASGGNAGILAYGHLPLPRPGLARKAVRWMLDPGSPLYVPPRWDPALWSWFLAFARACTQQRVDECMVTLAALGHEAMDGWMDLAARYGLGDTVRTAGWLDVFGAEAGRRAAAHEAELTRRHGFRAEMMSAQELKAREPAFNDAVLGAVHYPESISLDPQLAVRRLAEGLAATGAEVRTGCAAVSLLVEDGRCLGVRLAGGEEVRGTATVLAAGIWTSDLAAHAGIRLPQQGGKGYYLDLEPPAPGLNTAAVLAEAFVAVNPMPDRLRLAGTVEFSGTNRQCRPRRVEMLAAGAARFLPGTAAARRLGQGCELRPCLADGLLVVDRAPRLPGLFLVAGGAKVGMTLGPACGKLAADLISGATPTLDPRPLSADRFASGRS